MIKLGSGSTWLRIGAALAILFFLAREAGVETVTAHVSSARVEVLAGAMLFTFGESMVRIVNWRSLLASMQAQRLAFWGLVGCYFTSGVLGQFVPSTAGTDALRVMITQRRFGGSTAVYAASLVVLNAVMLFAGSLIGLLGLGYLYLTDQLPALLLVSLPVLLGISLLVPAVHVLLRWRRDLAIAALRRLRKPRWFRLRHALRRFVDALLVFEKSPGSLRRVMAIAVTAVLIQASFFAAVGFAFGVRLPIGVWSVFPPLIAVVGLMPLSVLGFGAQQGALVAVMTAFGVAPAEALAVSILAAFVSTSVWVGCGVVSLVVSQGSAGSMVAAGRK
jgi:uncharacterized membrane protein YbhN (UPF0104 family)